MTTPYKSATIYKLTNTVDDATYISGTCSTLKRRKAFHKKMAAIETDNDMLNHMTAVGWDNVRIVLVECWPCASKQELDARVAYWINEKRPTLNTKIHAGCKVDSTPPKITIRKRCPHNKEVSHCKECRPNITAKHVCSCGTIVQRRSLRQHLKSKKHGRLTAANNNDESG